MLAAKDNIDPKWLLTKKKLETKNSTMKNVVTKTYGDWECVVIKILMTKFLGRLKGYSIAIGFMAIKMGQILIALKPISSSPRWCLS